MHLSIIDPAYNYEAFVESSLGSLWVQTYDGYETIVVDDGSADGAGGLLDKCAKTHPNLRVIHGGNQRPLITHQNIAMQLRTIRVPNGSIVLRVN